MSWKCNWCIIPTILSKTSRTTNPKKDLRSLEPMEWLQHQLENKYIQIFSSNQSPLWNKDWQPLVPRDLGIKVLKLYFPIFLFIYKPFWEKEGDPSLQWIWLTTSILHFSRTPISPGKLNNIQFIFKPIHILSWFTILWNYWG